MNKSICTKSRVFISLVGTSEMRKSQFIKNWLEIGTIQPKFDKIGFFINTGKHFTTVCRKKLIISSSFKM